MSLPANLRERLTLPVIASPMFLVSGPALVIEACRAGIVGTFPALNQRSTDGYAAWLDEIERALEPAANTPAPAPFGVNLIVHRSNRRLDADLKLTVARKVPLIITSLGAVKDVVEAIHSYGGLVFHDVVNMRFAEKALEAGVDGLVAVCAGAGGHAGTLSPFGFIEELRRAFAGPIALSGAISTGAQIAAAELLGADLAYMGTRFLATRESLAPDAYKQMLVESRASDIVYTPAISGIPASFLRPSILAAGLDPENMTPGRLDLENEVKIWKDIWSAGHGVGGIADTPGVAELCARLTAEYRQARTSAPAWGSPA